MGPKLLAVSVHVFADSRRHKYYLLPHKMSAVTLIYAVVACLDFGNLARPWSNALLPLCM